MSGTSPNHNKAVIILVSVAILMFGVAFASVPLYRLFCQVTGFGGATRTSQDIDEEIQPIDRWMTVRFNTDTSPNLPWKFKPEQREIKIRVGESSLAFFSAENITDAPATGVATYNVTPKKAGEYFVKIQCFCFDNQTLEPGQKVHMPVSFYVDPSIAEDENLDDVKTITLSYTFFVAKDEK